MQRKIRKAVIPVAGLGTRFLPVTKTVPKELLPIVDKPILLFNFQEVMRAGIEEVILIESPGKEAINAFFGQSKDLEAALEKSGRSDVLEELREVRSAIKITSVRQENALGLGHAISMAEKAVGDEAFAVLLGDELMLPVPEAPSAIGQLCRLYEESGLSCVAVMPVADQEVSKYGIVAVQQERENLWRVTGVVEKPSLAEAPSRLALPGRYVFDPKIFEFLQRAAPGKNGEIQLTDSMALLAKSSGMLAATVKGRRYDAGDKFGFLRANIEIGLDRQDIGPALKDYLKELVRSFS